MDTCFDCDLLHFCLQYLLSASNPICRGYVYALSFYKNVNLVREHQLEPQLEAQARQPAEALVRVAVQAEAEEVAADRARAIWVEIRCVSSF